MIQCSDPTILAELFPVQLNRGNITGRVASALGSASLQVESKGRDRCEAAEKRNEIIAIGSRDRRPFGRVGRNVINGCRSAERQIERRESPAASSLITVHVVAPKVLHPLETESLNDGIVGGGSGCESRVVHRRC